MFDYTHQQHFQFGYVRPGRALTDENVQWMCHRKNPEDLFVAKYGRATKTFDSWRDANKAAALIILKSCRENRMTPLICYSGGLDSEIVLVSFLEARREFDPEFPIDVVTLVLKGDLNRHDTDFVDRFKERLSSLGHSSAGLKFKVQKLDASEFWNSTEFLSLAKETQIVSPIVICQAWLCGEMLRENPAYLPIIGQGEIHLVKDTPKEYQPGVSQYLPSLWRIAETENLCGLYRYFIRRSAPAVPGFFQFLPEQFETQLRTNPVIHELVSHTRVGKLGTRSSKREIVLHDYPELEIRPKFHGFETIEGEHDIWRKRLNEMMPECEGHWYLDFYSLYRCLRPELPGVFEHADWSFTIGREGRYRMRRLDEDDIFTTEWKTLTNPVLSGWNSVTDSVTGSSSSSRPDSSNTSSPDSSTYSSSDSNTDSPAGASPDSNSENSAAFLEIENAIQKFLSTSAKQYLLHDGSLAARWLFALNPDLMALGATQIPRMRPQEVVPEILQTDLLDADSLLLFLLAKSAKTETHNRQNTRLLIPKINSRIEEELGPVWIENERDARLLFNLRSHFHGRELAVPFSDFEIQSAVARSLRVLGPANWQRRLESRVAELESIRSIDISQFLNQSHALRRRVDGYLESLARPSFSTMNSSTTLPSGRAIVSGGAIVSGRPEIGCGLEGAELAFAAKGLTSIPVEEWLSRAKFATPDLKLGGNLYYRQTVYGRQLISKAFRTAVALQSPDGEYVSVACVQILDPEPNGTLRIRGVVTEPPFRRHGFARELLLRLAEALRSSPTLCSRFASVEVWAAPEIVSAFTAAGFIPDYHRSPKTEPLYITSENKVVPSNRVLQPMTMPLR